MHWLVRLLTQQTEYQTDIYKKSDVICCWSLEIVFLYNGCLGCSAINLSLGSLQQRILLGNQLIAMATLSA